MAVLKWSVDTPTNTTRLEEGLNRRSEQGWIVHSVHNNQPGILGWVVISYKEFA